MARVWTYDVFLSFCGEDTRSKFASTLFNALNQEGIQFFRENDQDKIGRVIETMLVDAIHHSRIGLILFSKNYADSKWCLNELVEILDCNRRHKNQHMVFPIFYDVKPSDVCTQSGDFGQRFAKCMGKHLDDKELVEKWRSALEVAGNLPGWDLTNDAYGDEWKVTQMIARQIQRKILQSRPLYNLEDVVGIEFIVDEIVSLCNMGSDDVRFIGMYGVQGIGKTVIAKMLHGHIFNEFDGFSFIEIVGDETKEDLVLHQKKLLDDILKPREDLKLYGVHTNKTEISKRLWRKKVLVILDNVVNGSQVDALAGDRDWFGLGSKILVISRDKQVLKDLDIDDKYMVIGLDMKASIQLFCKHAFQRDDPYEGYEELCRSFVHYTGGLPSALKGLGSLLSKKTKKQWHKMLDELEKEPHLDTIGVHYGPLSSLFSYKPTGQHGGLGGLAFDDGIYTGVRQVTVCVGRPNYWPIPFMIIYYDLSGCLISSSMHGLPPPSTFLERVYEVKLNYPNEYLVSISGFVGESSGAYVVNSLKFTSNRKTYGPFGIEKGTSFTSSIETNGKIVGLMGRNGSNLHAIGAYVAPNSHTYPFQVVGPVGGENGEFWNDGKYTDIRQIRIISNGVIEAITVIYDNHGRISDIITHGRIGNGGTTYMVELDYPYEYLTSISGYTTVNTESIVSIQSITFQSNVRRYGPFGEEKGRYFSFPGTGGKIVGFFGSIHANLESIGAYFEPVSHNYHFKTVGPFGGGGGQVWDDGQHDDVKEISITCGDVIDSVCFRYADDDQLSLPLSRHGGFSGTTHTIKLDYPDEYITSISGYFGGSRGNIIHYLTFQSTRRIYGPFGTKGESISSRYFSLPSNLGKVVGFYGRCGDYLDSIGAYVKPYSKKLFPYKSVGLYGGADGDPWDDGNGAHIRQIGIVLHHDDSAIRSIGFVYDKAGSLVQSPIDGVDRNRKKHEINLDDGEYLTSLSGYIIGDDCDHVYIGSLTFQSNRSMYGPFGAEKGKYFACPATGGKISGFYGRRSKDCLNAIGAYFEPIPLVYPQRMVGPFGGQGGRFWFWHQKDPSEVIKVDVQGVMTVNISWGDAINSICIRHEVDGNPVVTGVRGQTDNGNNERIHLEYPSEYLTSISGYIRDDSSGPVVIRSLTFHSNLRRYGPYGKEEGKFFWYPSSGTRIIGFYGRAGQHLDAIGVYTEPIPHLYPLRSMGPFGGAGGTTWNDGIFTDLRGVVISVGSVVSSISFQYDNNGTAIQCSKHGSPGDQEYQVKLDFPKEYLVSISGYTKEYSGSIVIGSLTFESNTTKYGPYGNEEGAKFSISGRIIGFVGSSGSVLNSIGAHLEPFSTY